MKVILNGHFYISLVKSSIRILAAYFLYNELFVCSAVSFASAEIMGVVEEFYN